jgi:hypothetical protein
MSVAELDDRRELLAGLKGVADLPDRYGLPAALPGANGRPR